MNRIAAAVLFTALVAPGANAAGASPAVGDVFIYRVTNGYSREARGTIRYQIDKVDADRVTVSMTTDNTSLGMPHTEVYTKDGNWLRHTLINHDQPVEYEFSPPYPAYMFPLDAGKSWSLRVTAINPITGKRNSVRVDGDVLGSERISTSAGTFDTIKVRRRAYAGDAEYFRGETNILETDWYAPALGRAVRVEYDSAFSDPNQCQSDGSMSYNVPLDTGKFGMLRVAAAHPIAQQRSSVHDAGQSAGDGHSESDSVWPDSGRLYGFMPGCSAVRGDWNIVELIELRSARP